MPGVRHELRGAGNTPVPPTGSYSDADDLVEAMGGEPAALVGSSFGGWVCLQVATARPELVTDLVLHGKVEADLAKKYSPEQIACRLKVDFPDQPEMQVSTETIYQSLYVQARGALKRDLTMYLRTGRASGRGWSGKFYAAESRSARIDPPVMDGTALARAGGTPEAPR